MSFFEEKRNGLLVAVALLGPIITNACTMWALRNYEFFSLVVSPFEGVRPFNDFYRVLYFSWPALLSIYFIKASSKKKWLLLGLYALVWGPVVFGALILSAVFIGGAYS